MTSDRRLLILDDDPAIGQMLKDMAEEEGFHVQSATTAEAFFGALNAWDPTHLVLDLVMPDMDGVEVLRNLAARTCRARIVVMSGIGEKVLGAAQRTGLERGLDIAGILPKPFRAQVLLDLLESTGGSGRSRSQAVPAPLLEDELQGALRAGQFILYYQPKIDLKDGALKGFEALVRWIHPQSGLIPPDVFIPVAEESGFIHVLTEEIIAQALAWFPQLPGRKDLSISINLSARSLRDLDLVNRLYDRCSVAGISPGQVVLELTETSAMQDPAAALDILTRLRIKGFQLALDDFGTGYSSMAQLSRLPFTELKVDKSFVMSMGRSEEARKIVASTLGLGAGLGLTTVAEGVEDAETARLLAELRCDLAQGYHFARPLPPHEALAWASAHGLR